MEFVSDISRHFRVSSMLAKERYGAYHVALLKYMYSFYFLSASLSLPLLISVKQRLSTVEGLSCAEFLYPIFQAYDFLQLHKQHSCWIQVKF